MPVVKVNYKRIHYRDVGPPDGTAPRETFILVHGLGSTQNYYAGVTPTLTKHNYRCVCLDTTGSGRSPYTGIEQSATSLATDIVDVMDALSIPKAVVVAHSMGGITGPQAAALFPNRVSALVLLGPVLPTKDVEGVFLQRIEAVETKGMEAMADMIPYAAVGSKATPIHSAFIRELLLSIEPAAYVSLCRVIAGAYRSPVDYASIKCPLLIIAGSEDKSAPLAGCEKILSSVGSEEKEMIVMNGIGHWMAVECAEDVGKAIVGFFRQIQ